MSTIRITIGAERAIREGKVSMRCTLLAMIEEFARHAGHGDILREQIDKATPRQPNP